MKTFTAFRTMLVTMAMILAAYVSAVSQTAQFGIMTDPANHSVIQVKVKSDVTYPTGSYITDVCFTIRWRTDYGISLGTWSSNFAMDLPQQQNQTYTVGAYTCADFFYNGTTSPFTLDAGVELLLVSIPINQTGVGQGTFEFVTTGLDPDFHPTLVVNNVQVNLINPTTPFYIDNTSVPLPVELVSFSAVTDNAGAKLAWKTATETNNAGFEIERSLSAAEPSAMKWTKVGYVEGSGTCNAEKNYSFRDKNMQTGTYSFRLKQIDRDGNFSYSNVIETIIAAPKEFTMSQNYPNPFNPTTTINYTLAENSRVTVKVYDLTGREVVTLVDGDVAAGYFSLPFDGRNLASGVYLYRIAAQHGGSTFVQTKRLMLLK